MRLRRQPGRPAESESESWSLSWRRASLRRAPLPARAQRAGQGGCSIRLPWQWRRPAGRPSSRPAVCVCLCVCARRALPDARYKRSAHLRREATSVQTKQASATLAKQNQPASQPACRPARKPAPAASLQKLQRNSLTHSLTKPQNVHFHKKQKHEMLAYPGHRGAEPDFG